MIWKRHHFELCGFELLSLSPFLFVYNISLAADFEQTVLKNRAVMAD